MAVSDVLNRRVRALPEEEEFSGLSGSDNAENASDSDSGSGSGEESGEDEGDDISEEGSEEEESDAANEDVRSSLNNVSFGALVKAQASLGGADADRGRKRKRSDSTSKEEGKKGFAIEEIRAKIREAREQRREKEGGGDKKDDKEGKDGKKEGDRSKRLSRSSKHAPTVQSSKYAVSRKRTVVEPLNVAKARDPRFDSVVLNSGNGKDHNSIVASAAAAASKNYAFLNDYRESELAALREQLKKTKAPAEQEEIKGKIRSMTDRQRAFDSKQREREIRSQHRKKERELIREGKKSQPYFLKDADVKREMLVQKFEGMGGKEKRRALERRRKKVAGKEKKEMPWGRREVGGGGSGGGENQGRRWRNE
ncbi:rRNA biogenesis protein rrp36 [Arachnomyces sp. PD_36]|nr:rRNA biogenesis protein rrp36 [Arachnomyces sp. PD_36]